MGSIAFDQAADYYDRTRALPEDVQAQVTAFLVSELRGRTRVLELGVGTGRMALPVAAAGVDVVGVDLSEPMLHRLKAKAGAVSVPVLRGDGLALPFAPGIFGAGYLCHVLHLIPDWRAAVAEVVRVMTPGGHLLIDIGGSTTEGGRAVGAFFQEAAGAGPLRPGVRDPGSLDAGLAELGCRPLQPVTIPFGIDYTVTEILERLERNEWSSTWSLSDDVRLRAVAETRAWAEGRWGDLDAPLHEDSQIVWRRYETSAPPGR
jgi:SAM-dependent methyltransferase